MRKYNKVLFVSTENTGRSPMAEMIFKNMVTDPTVEAISRGMIVLFPEPCNQKAEVVLINHGIKLEGRKAVQLQREDMDDRTLVLTMSLNQKNKLIRDYGYSKNIYTLKEFIDEEDDVMDPYGGTLVEYEECYSELAKLIKKAVVKLRNKYDLKD